MVSHEFTDQTAARSLALIQLGVAEEATGNSTTADEYQQRGIAELLVELGHLRLDVKDFEGASARFAEAVVSYRDPELVSRGDASTALQYRMALLGLAEAANGAGMGEQAVASGPDERERIPDDVADHHGEFGLKSRRSQVEQPAAFSLASVEKGDEACMW